MPNELVIEGVEHSEVLRNIPVNLDINKVKTRLEFHRDVNINSKDMLQLVKQVVSTAKPEAIYKSSQVTDKTGKYLKIDGIKFNKPLLRVNLKQVDHVFPYVVTCGPETDSLMLSGNQASLSYVVNIIQEMVLAEATNYVQRYIADRYNLDYLWSLQPGELQAWPAEDRILLFPMLGNVEGLIGVRLLINSSLEPDHAVCGIFYYSGMEFEGCQVCSQEPCMGRRAPYCEELAQKYPDRARIPCGGGNRQKE